MQYASLISVESPAVTKLLRKRLLGAGAAFAALVLSACSGGSGADVEETPALPGSGPTSN